MNINNLLLNLLNFLLALLQDMKLHEESCLAVCLQFHSFSGTPNMWVVYCVQQLETLAKLYSTLRHAAATRNSNMYVSRNVLNYTVCTCAYAFALHVHVSMLSM